MRNENGKVTFSRDFMNKLEEKLGRKALKANDFTLDYYGNVISGKPLTARRVRKILRKIEISEFSKTMEVRPPEQIDYDKYAQKLTNIMDKFKGNPLATKTLQVVDRCLTALNNCAKQNSTIIVKNDHNRAKRGNFNFAMPGINKPFINDNYLLTYLTSQTGLPYTPNDKVFKKITDNIDMEDKGTKIFLKSTTQKLLNKYHGGKAPEGYDYRDDLIRNLQDHLVKFVRLTVDLYDKCEAQNKLDKFEDFLSWDAMRNGSLTTKVNNLQSQFIELDGKKDNVTLNDDIKEDNIINDNQDDIINDSQDNIIKITDEIITDNIISNTLNDNIINNTQDDNIIINNITDNTRNNDIINNTQNDNIINNNQKRQK